MPDAGRLQLRRVGPRRLAGGLRAHERSNGGASRMVSAISAAIATGSAIADIDVGREPRGGESGDTPIHAFEAPGLVG